MDVMCVVLLESGGVVVEIQEAGYKPLDLCLAFSFGVSITVW